jgi:Sulfotransferase family
MVDFHKFQQTVASNASVRSRLEYGTFVSIGYRYLYVETPKVACTSIKSFLHTLEELPPIQPFSGSYESKLSMFIHDRQQFALPSLHGLTPTLQEQVLNDPSWFRFALIRNPYSRLFSAWYSKICMVEPDFEYVARQIRNSFPEGPLPTFSEFVNFVCDREDLSICNAHWQLQSDLVFSDLLNSLRIYKLENVTAFVDAFTTHLQTQGYSQPVSLPIHNEAPSIDWRRFYDTGLANRVFGKYRRDFDQFDYSRDSWLDDPDPVLRNQDAPVGRLRAYYEREIYERNRLIAALYSLAHSRRS